MNPVSIAFITLMALIVILAVIYLVVTT